MITITKKRNRKAVKPPMLPVRPETVRAVRAATGWSQQRLAYELGWAKPCVERWETGRGPIPPGIRLELLGLITREKLYLPLDILQELCRRIVVEPPLLELTPE